MKPGTIRRSWVSSFYTPGARAGPDRRLSRAVDCDITLFELPRPAEVSSGYTRIAGLTHAIQLANWIPLAGHQDVALNVEGERYHWH